MMKLDDMIETELAACPLPWSLEQRRRHVLLRIVVERFGIEAIIKES